MTDPLTPDDLADIKARAEHYGPHGPIPTDVETLRRLLHEDVPALLALAEEQAKRRAVESQEDDSE